MIVDPILHARALRALNAVLFMARSIAYRGQSGGCEAAVSDLARILDLAEFLPLLLLDANDKAAEFRAYLVQLVDDYPEMETALRKFDGGV